MSFGSDFVTFARHPRQQPTNLAFFNGFMYGLSLNAMSLLIPLYAIQQGFRLSDQGILIAAPAVFMILLRLPGGAISDRFGERVVITFAFSSLLISSVIAIFADNIGPLLVSQLLNGASRSVYWSAAQSYISRSAEGQAGKMMGRQLAFETGAGILGSLATGFVAEIFGFRTAFVIASLLATGGLMVTSSLPSLPRKDQARSIKESFAPVRPMLFSRSLAFAHLVAFMAAAYGGLVGGLFIAYFRDLGYSEGLTGLVRSLNSLGVVIVAFFFGTLLARCGARLVGVLGMVLTGIVCMATAASGHIPIVPIILMTASGATFGMLRTLYPSITAEKSNANQRAMALAVVSLYWAVAMLLSPLVFGFIADWTDIPTAIYIFGGFSVVAGLLSPLAYALGESRDAQKPASVEAARSA
jgi:MFS family permease